MVPLGIYISVPFCRSKCSYCNFASDVVSSRSAGGHAAQTPVYERYVKKVCGDIRDAEKTAKRMGGEIDREVDSIYIGGGTPTVLDSAQLGCIFSAIRESFTVLPESEITVECAPGTLSSDVLNTLVSCGVNRASLGAQSLVDEETRAVGRLHTRTNLLDDIRRLRAVGITNLNLDLIAGLPHQTAESWDYSLRAAIDTGTSHVSVYMLEIDQDSRLGREVIADGTRYHAHFVPDEDLVADLYSRACETLNAAGIAQYEISNFARSGFESRHNLKYWTRQAYLGFGLDAHSFLPAAHNGCVPLPQDEDSGRIAQEEDKGSGDPEKLVAVRFATTDLLESYLTDSPLVRTPVSCDAAREECFFLGLRLNHGVELESVARQYGSVPKLRQIVSDLCQAALLEYDQTGQEIRLTAKGRLLSNEVFQRFIA